jgi:cyclopropane-fatty-acyl-phospholipid synthase
MFEHVRNYEELFRRISSWLLPQGKLFFHIFCHRLWPYTFEVTGKNDWMSRHFFTGGIMPCVELPYQFSRGLVVEEHWTLNGMHYSQTCESWLTRLDRQYPDLLQFFEHPQGGDRREVQLQRWRMFFMACSELFRYDRGCEWMIGHYRLHSSH